MSVIRLLAFYPGLPIWCTHALIEKSLNSSNRTTLYSGVAATFQRLSTVQREKSISAGVISEHKVFVCLFFLHRPGKISATYFLPSISTFFCLIFLFFFSLFLFSNPRRFFSALLRRHKFNSRCYQF